MQALALVSIAAAEVVTSGGLRPRTTTTMNAETAEYAERRAEYEVSGFSGTRSKEAPMYEFDPRRPEDPHYDNRERDLSRGSRGGSDSRNREPVDPREVFTSQVYLPRGMERDRVEFRGVEYTL